MRRIWSVLVAATAAFGLAVVAVLLLPSYFSLSHTPLLPIAVSAMLGACSYAAAGALVSHRWEALVVCVMTPLLVVWPVGLILVVPVDLVVLASFTVGAAALASTMSSLRSASLGAMAALTSLAMVGTVAGAGAWSVDEPGANDPRMIAGNGVVVAVDTHAFLIQQGAQILRADGHTAIADFLASPDPTAPLVRTASGIPTARHESYLWRMQLASRDADRSLKATQMPDHFFNWWTHSGKAMVAGTSAATWAEQQFVLATGAWRAGDRASAMYHLGAATHLVADGCTPPHQSPYVPNHRVYEDWMLAHQGPMTVTRGGIYRADFRVKTGHGGPEWSSSHTRGWVDECAHRGAELVLATGQPPPDDPASGDPYDGTAAHFKDAQRLTAGYIAFFFETVKGPR